MQEVISELKVLNTDSSDLTFQFFADLAEIQAEKVQSGEKQLGELLVSMAYNSDKEVLDVHVIQGRGLPVMDKTGEEVTHRPIFLVTLYLTQSVHVPIMTPYLLINPPPPTNILIPIRLC